MNKQNEDKSVLNIGLLSLYIRVSIESIKCVSDYSCRKLETQMFNYRTTFAAALQIFESYAI